MARYTEAAGFHDQLQSCRSYFTSEIRKQWEKSPVHLESKTDTIEICVQ